MHLNERLEKSREALGMQLAAGQQKVSTAYNRLWAEMEAMREAQRKRAEEQRAMGGTVDAQGKCKSPTLSHTHLRGHVVELSAVLTIATGKSQAPDLSAASKSAGAYFSSWGTWASEKRKGWGNKTPVSSPSAVDMKRADTFQREKEGVVGIDGRVEGVGNGNGKEEGKRESVFFDAERSEERVGEKERGEGKM
jgi:hypothetical protein